MGELPERRKRQVELKPGARLQELPKFEQSPGTLRDAREASVASQRETVPAAGKELKNVAIVTETPSPAALPVGKVEDGLPPSLANDKPLPMRVRVGLSKDNERLAASVLAKWGGDRAALLSTVARATTIEDADFRAGGIVVPRNRLTGEVPLPFNVAIALFEKWRALIDPSKSLKPGEVASVAVNIAFNRTATEILKNMLKE